MTGEFLVGHRMLNGTVNGGPSVLDATDWYTFEVEQKQVAALLSSAPGLQMELFEDVDRNGVLVSTESRGKATSDDGLPDEIRHRSTASKAKYFLRVLKPTSGSQFYSVGLAGTK